MITGGIRSIVIIDDMNQLFDLDFASMSAVPANLKPGDLVDPSSNLVYYGENDADMVGTCDKQ